MNKMYQKKQRCYFSALLLTAIKVLPKEYYAFSLFLLNEMPLAHQVDVMLRIELRTHMKEFF